MVKLTNFGSRYKGTDTYYKPERSCKICDAHMGFSRYVPTGDNKYCRSCRSKRVKLKEILIPGFNGVSDPEVYNNGIFIGILVGGSAKLIERFIKSVSNKTNTKTDWDYVGGRACVQTLGNIDIVKSCIVKELNSNIFDDEPCKYNKLLDWYSRG